MHRKRSSSFSSSISLILRGRKRIHCKCKQSMTSQPHCFRSFPSNIGRGVWADGSATASQCQQRIWCWHFFHILKRNETIQKCVNDDRQRSRLAAAAAAGGSVVASIFAASTCFFSGGGQSRNFARFPSASDSSEVYFFSPTLRLLC